MIIVDSVSTQIEASLEAVVGVGVIITPEVKVMVDQDLAIIMAVTLVGTMGVSFVVVVALVSTHMLVGNRLSMLVGSSSNMLQKGKKDW